MEPLTGIAVVTLLLAIFAAQSPSKDRPPQTLIRLLLPYIFVSVSVLIGFVIRPDQPFYGLLLYPAIGLVQILSITFERYR